MKILVLTLFLILTGCKEVKEFEREFCDKFDHPKCVNVPQKRTEFVEVTPEYLYRTDYNGVYTELGQNSWSYKSHMVPHFYEEIPGVYCHFCRKVQTHYYDGKAFTPGRQVEYTFDFTVDKWNYIDPPFSVIVFQQWARKTSTENIIHPITTLKLRKWKGLSLGLSDQAWQFENHSANPYDINDPDDKKHRHPESRDNGHQALNVGQTYKIKLLMNDGFSINKGAVRLYVDNQLVGISFQRVRSISEPNTIMWGLYWQNGHKNGYNGHIQNKCSAVTGEDDLVCKSIQTTVANFRVRERFL